MRMRNLPESRRHAPVNSVISQYDRLNAVSHGKGENAPHGALCSRRRANGIKRSTTIRTPSPPRQTDPSAQCTPTRHIRPGPGRTRRSGPRPSRRPLRRAPRRRLPLRSDCGPVRRLVRRRHRGLGGAGSGAARRGPGRSARGRLGAARESGSGVGVGSGSRGRRRLPPGVGCAGCAGLAPEADRGAGDAAGGRRLRRSADPCPPCPCPCLPALAVDRGRAEPGDRRPTPPARRRAPHRPAARRSATASALPPRRRRRHSCSPRQRRRPRPWRPAGRVRTRGARAATSGGG